jgi:ubiquitin
VNVTVKYSEAGLSANPGTAYTETTSNLAAGASFTFFENSGDGDDMPTGVLAAAVVSAVYSDGSGAANIAAIVNETKWPSSQPQTLAQTTYGAIPVSAGTAKIGVPLAKEVFGATGKRTETQHLNRS